MLSKRCSLRIVPMVPKRLLIEIPESSYVVQITDDGSRTLIDPASEVAFHSGSGALAETRHVYLKNSGVSERLACGKPTSVLEIGLGTGLGMLLTVEEAVGGSAPLEYHAIEIDWLPIEVLQHLRLQTVLGRPAIVDSYFTWRAGLGLMPTRGRHVWRFNEGTNVCIHHHDARGFEFRDDEKFDAIYFDPFAPNVNHELWTDAFLSRMYRTLRVGGHLVTYCVNRRVKDSLVACGFEVKCLPGPLAGKREVMRATRRQ